MTERLFLANSYQKEFCAEILKKIPLKNKIGLLLDRTCFYPTSGGQLCDRGTIEMAAVLDVYEENDDIIHVVDSALPDFNITGKIDWENRFGNMQQHTGQHILSQSFIKLLNADTLSSTLGRNTCTVDINKKELTDEEAEKVEDFANHIIYENREIKVYSPEEEELQKIPLRKKPPKGKKTRIVEVDNFDFSACGGTHCKNAGEVGIIKIFRWEKYKGNTRVEFNCGLRALKDYRQKSMIIGQLVELLSEQESEILNKSEKIIDDNKILRKKCSSYSEELLTFEAEKMYDQAAIFNDLRIVKKVFENRQVEDIKHIALKLKQYDNCISLLGIKNQKGQIIFTCSENLALNMGELLKEIFATFKGRGGGTSYFAQGGCDPINIEKAVELAYQMVNEDV